MPKRYSFRVVIEQDDPQEGRDFGSKDGWANIIRQRLDRDLLMANVVSVEPIRNRKGEKRG